MPFSPRIFASLLLLVSSAAVAQPAPSPAPLPVRAVRTISPTDTAFADLEFLRQEIGTARVVMLGEPTHGEGNVFEAKIRLMRFLQRRLGFTTVAFESGFYELDRAQRALQTGTAAAEAIDNSVFPVWTSTREFRELLPLLGPGKLKVAGFDYQLSGAYQDELLEELETFLKPEKGADGIAYDYLDECLSVMGEHFLFPPSHQMLLFDMQMGKARKLLQKVVAGPDKQRRERAAFWLQTLRSLEAAAHDYATNDPGTKTEAEFKAVDSNPRDAQMADNLLWYLRQHPREKVICWGALPHLANKVEVLADAEIKTYKPMGRAVKAALGDDAVYVLGTLAGSGTHGFLGMGGYQPVPAPAAGTLEAALLAQGPEYSFVSLKHDAKGKELTTYAFEYQPQTGPWSEVVDGFLFLKSVNPPHGATATVAAATPAATVASVASQPAAPRRLNPAARRAAPTGAALALTGTVLDRKTGQPVPFATVAVPGRSAATVSDAQGRFRLPVRRGETVQASCIGYESRTWQVQGAGAEVVRLQPAAYALGTVRVSAASQDPRRIMKKVMEAMPRNYEQQDYGAEAYVRRRLVDFDTLRYEVEYVSDVFEPAGFRHWAGGFLMLGPKPTHKVREKHEPVPAARPLGFGELSAGGHGFHTEGTDPVRISPLFKAGTLGKYALRLDTIEQRGGDTFFVIGFAAKRANHRTTGQYLEASYAGKVYVRQQDYAVVRYEALWGGDTVQWNATARKYQGRRNTVARLYPQVFSDRRKAHVVTYERGPNGRYHVSSSVAQSRNVGHKLDGKPFFSQQSCEVYFAPLPAAALANYPDREKQPELAGGEFGQLPNVPHRPEFWQSYQRPVPAEPLPTLNAAKP